MQHEVDVVFILKGSYKARIWDEQSTHRQAWEALYQQLCNFFYWKPPAYGLEASEHILAMARPGWTRRHATEGMTSIRAKPVQTALHADTQYGVRVTYYPATACLGVTWWTKLAWCGISWLPPAHWKCLQRQCWSLRETYERQKQHQVNKILNSTMTHANVFQIKLFLVNWKPRQGRQWKPADWKADFSILKYTVKREISVVFFVHNFWNQTGLWRFIFAIQTPRKVKHWRTRSSVQCTLLPDFGSHSAQ